ncbi:hypothetical protein [Neisseria dumasiana]|uniref:Uncharacterized protein n=1 Tax=Neisseria dumasiana TaxID=1931275 RepID=A0ABX3WP65_9NEIS|nr:hypothetical protein [Neisseria dumasiana]OSI35832.1 hypothetical protein BV913_04150 [Neisseria dumasiana]UOO85302.1 hypothetical protein LVJ88_04790 [Neisseria dumasiana]
MKKYLILLALLSLIAACNSKKDVQILPDAELGEPYSVRIDFSNGQRTYPDFFKVTILPADSGLSDSGLTGKWDNETVISGIPKVKQDISIEIYYLILGPVGFFEDKEQTKFYKIKVKE